MAQRLQRQANMAHRQEMQAERKEARLHNKAVNQALRGNFGRAMALENRANNQSVRADRAHAREQAATAAFVATVTDRRHHPHCPAPVVPVVAPGVASYTVTQTTYGPPPPPTTYYPTGQIPPPQAPQPIQPPAGAYYPPPPYNPYHPYPK